MPPTRHISKQQPSPKPFKKKAFTFPGDSHLLVTTPSHVYAWDSVGVHTIFSSSKSSIVAAKEAKDGSGVLAVADKHVVVLHDTKRGQEKSWGLNADDDEVRHLEYTTDAKLLFLSTTLTNDVQRYSTERSRLLAPSRAHATPPVALAISPTGHLLVSASDNPPAVYLKDLKQNSAPTLIESQASQTCVSKIAFHPERPNIFLLAFRDGTVAAYDATRINRNHRGTFANQETVNAGEISRMLQLHRTTSQTLNTPSISDADFLPGYKTRAITTGEDGRCRLVDFADGGIILRTWHAKAPVTSVSILSKKSEPSSRKQVATNGAPHVLGGPTSTNNLVAIGRADGKVHIYDSLGLLLGSQAINSNGEKVISVEWAKGMAPAPIADSIISENRTSTLARNTEAEKPVMDSEPKQIASARTETMFEHVGLPPALRRPKQQEAPRPPMRFTIHPDEMDEGTVRHNPAFKSAEPVPVERKDYLDLFSPVKAPNDLTQGPSVKPLSSPPRIRPRVSPQTFVKSPEATPAGQDSSISKPRNLTLFPSTDSSSSTPRPAASEHIGHTRLHPSPPGPRVTFKPASQRRLRRSSPYRVNKVRPNQNAKLLADLRKLSTDRPTQRSNGTLSTLAPSKPVDAKQHDLPAKMRNSCMLRRQKDHIETDVDSEKALQIYEHAHRKRHWPEDSNQDTSLDGDIWLTSNSEEETTHQSRRRRQAQERPPARQTSRSRMNSKGTMSTLAQVPPELSDESRYIRPTFDGSTEDDMQTARTHLSPNGALSPSSSDVRSLFPRTSSLSPTKSERSRKQTKTALDGTTQPLREVALNSLSRRHAMSPWARVEAENAKQGKRLNETKRTTMQKVADFEDDPHCDICLPTKVRVSELEDEVARLKGEVITMKAILRRNGIQLPLLVR